MIQYFTFCLYLHSLKYDSQGEFRPLVPLKAERERERERKKEREREREREREKKVRS